MTPAAEITVGICTLDRPAALARCLDGLLAGSRLPAEVIVVDQGATPAQGVVDKRASRFHALRHVPMARLGLSAARNVVLRHAQHPIVAVTDDDCVPDRDWVAALLDGFERAPVPDAVTGRVLALPATDGATHAVSLRTSPVATDFTGDAIPWDVGTGANFAVRRQAILALGGYDERLGTGSPGQAAEDLELSLRLLRAGARIRYEPAAVIHHERQSDARRVATRWSYGHGIGALAGMLARRQDRFALTLLATFGGLTLRRLLRAARDLDRSGVHQALLSVGGTARGLAYGWHVEALSRVLSGYTGDSSHG